MVPAPIERSELPGHRQQIGKSAALSRVTHHDALEFPDGQILLLTLLEEGQHATVLQLPAGAAVGAKATQEAAHV